MKCTHGEQSQGAWQTKLDTYSQFPQCCQSFQDMNVHTDNAYGQETAFFCEWSMQSGHSIIESECQGQECPYCKIVGMEEYQKRIKTT